MLQNQKETVPIRQEIWMISVSQRHLGILLVAKSPFLILAAFSVTVPTAHPTEKKSHLPPADAWRSLKFKNYRGGESWRIKGLTGKERQQTS